MSDAPGTAADKRNEAESGASNDDVSSALFADIPALPTPAPNNPNNSGSSGKTPNVVCDGNTCLILPDSTKTNGEVSIYPGLADILNPLPNPATAAEKKEKKAGPSATGEIDLFDGLGDLPIPTKPSDQSKPASDAKPNDGSAGAIQNYFNKYKPAQTGSKPGDSGYNTQQEIGGPQAPVRPQLQTVYTDKEAAVQAAKEHNLKIIVFSGNTDSRNRETRELAEQMNALAQKYASDPATQGRIVFLNDQDKDNRALGRNGRQSSLSVGEVDNEGRLDLNSYRGNRNSDTLDNWVKSNLAEVAPVVQPVQPTDNPNLPVQPTDKTEKKEIYYLGKARGNDGRARGEESYNEFEQALKVAAQNGAALHVDFSAEWCPHCPGSSKGFLEDAKDNKSNLQDVYLHADVDFKADLSPEMQELFSKMRGGSRGVPQKVSFRPRIDENGKIVLD
jgi:thiol-disulfide isomerase/thioredoxin